MALAWTKRMLVERVRKHLAGGFPQADFNVTNNEVLLYIDAAIPFVLKGLMYENAKSVGLFETPDAFLVSYTFAITVQKADTNEWTITLPQPPLALPTGYDIQRVYVSGVDNGEGEEAYPIKNKRAGLRKYLPHPVGYNYRVEGQTMFLKATDNAPLYNETVTVTMPVSRTANLDDPLYLPDDVLEALFQKAVSQLKERFALPQDTIQDDLPAGDKRS